MKLNYAAVISVNTLCIYVESVNMGQDLWKQSGFLFY